MIVCVEISENEHAAIYTEDRRTQMMVPVGHVKRRLLSTRRAFFHATIESGCLELGERAEWQAW